MDFKSIENLLIEDISDLYDEYLNDYNHISYVGTECFTHIFSSSLKCINKGDNSLFWCTIDCTDKLIFTNEAMRQKCYNYCGSSDFRNIWHNRFDVNCEYFSTARYGCYQLLSR